LGAKRQSVARRRSAHQVKRIAHELRLERLPKPRPSCRRQRALIYGPACPLPACAKETEAGLMLGFEDATPRPTAYKDACSAFSFDAHQRACSPVVKRCREGGMEILPALMRLLLAFAAAPVLGSFSTCMTRATVGLAMGWV
jgi:hypothetical protein